ncbi:MFS transporter [Rossellomorea sp. NS-SX7]|uniref:MFS transporter n=1 Tax=Rossellomorea sp. NS-SX7 TaxID=3463856 RepID=UPI00405872BF
MGKKLTFEEVRSLFFYSKNYFLFFLGWAISLFGSSLTRIALPILILERTGSGFAMGMTFALETIPSALLGPLLGALSDRYNRKIMIITSDVLRALILIAVLLTGNLYIIFTLIFLMGILKALYVPVRSAIIPELVSKENFPKIVVLQGTTQRIINIAGPSLAAAIIGFTNPTFALQLDIITYLAAALLSYFVYIPIHKISKENGIVADMKEGFVYLFNHSMIRKLNFFWVILNFGFGGLTVLLLLYLEEINMDNATYGLLMTVLTIGMLLGTMAASKVKDNQKEKIIDLLPLTFGVCYSFLLFDVGTLVLFIIVLILGLNFGLYNVMASIIFGLNIPNEIRGRVYANATAFTTLAFSSSTILAGAMKAYFTVSTIFFVIGIVVAVCSLVVMILHHKKSPQHEVKKAMN